MKKDKIIKNIIISGSFILFSGIIFYLSYFLTKEYESQWRQSGNFNKYNTTFGILGIISITGIVVASIFFFFSFHTYFMYKKILKEMSTFESKNISYSKLYYQSPKKGMYCNIYDIITHLDGEKVFRGFDNLGKYIYITDKETNHDIGLNLIPTYVKVSNFFFQKEYNLKPHYIKDMIPIFFYEKVNNLLLFDENECTFIIRHNWNGEFDDYS